MREMPGKVSFGRSHANPLVGRDAELAALRRLLLAPEQQGSARVATRKQTSAIPLDTQRQPQCMVVMGEAGLGKTRLAEEMSRDAQDRGWLVAWSRSYAQESSIPYRAWIDILRGILETATWPKQALETNPRLAYLSVLSGMTPIGAAATFSLSAPPEQEQQRLWEAMLEFFSIAIEHAPLLVTLDDIQWADTGSCELLGYLARRLSGRPIIFLATCRDTELPPRHPLRQLLAHMQREHTVTTLSLQPLNAEQIDAMLSHFAVPGNVAHDIQQQASGNPFFAEELAYAYTSRLQVAERRERQGLRSRDVTLPRSIAAALDSRVGRLSVPCQLLLSDAAVLGGSFDLRTIMMMQLESGDAGRADEDAALDMLDEAVHAGVIGEEGKGDNINYHFWQPLLVSHLYDRLSATKRALLHRRAASILRRAYAPREEQGAAAIVRHLAAGGGEARDIVHYAEMAGNAAYALSVYPEAERHYRLALEHLKPDGDERTRLALLLERLGECLRIQGQYEEARQNYEQALAERGYDGAINRAATTAEATAATKQYEPQVDALLWSEIGWTWYYAGDYTRTRDYIERGEQVLQAAIISDGPAWARLFFLRGYVLWQEGRLEEARQAADRALALFEDHLHTRRDHDTLAAPLTRLRRTLDGDPVDVARTQRLLGALAASAGQLAQSLSHSNMALALLEQHDHKREMAHVSCNVGYIHLQQGEYDLARTFLQRSLALAEEIGDVPLSAVVISNLGTLAARTGVLAEAESQLRRALSIAEQVDDHVYMSMWNVELAGVLQERGQLDEARACIGRALAIGRSMRNTPCLGLALTGLARLRLSQAREQSDAAERQRLLSRARHTAQHALRLAGVEAETRTKAERLIAEMDDQNDL
jgi:tetratricopeptide (TPR) repeat protein